MHISCLKNKESDSMGMSHPRTLSVAVVLCISLISPNTRNSVYSVPVVLSALQIITYLSRVVVLGGIVLF